MGTTLTFTKSQSDLIRAVGFTHESKRRQIALIALAEVLPEHGLEKNYLRSVFLSDGRDRYWELCKEEYGFFIVALIFLTVLGAALSWAVERFLDWLFPAGVGASGHRRDRVIELRTAWSKGL